MTAICLLAALAGIEGQWLGTLDAGPLKLRLVLKVRQAETGLAAALDSVDQGAKDLPIDSIRVDGEAVRFEMKRLRAAFAGRRTGDEITGEWTQGGATLPLVFRRVEQAPVLQRPQEPKRPFAYREMEAVFENKKAGIQLAGTLTLPRGQGPFPAVVLLSGSGPQDRDEAVFGHRPFLVWSDHLTRLGIAVLRYDDRGVGKSGGKFADATTADFADDAEAALEFLKRRSEIDPKRIGLVGHSEGGIIAPMVAARRADVAFLVLLAGSGVTGEQLLYRQGELLGRAAGASRQQLDEQRRMQEKTFAGPNQPAWLRFFLTYDPAPALRKVTCPVLAMNGELDRQVDPDQNLPAIEAALKAGGNTGVRIVKLPKLNHLFQTVQTGALSEYAATEETLAPAALKTASDWIRSIIYK
jgi:hypothetical protein